MNVRLRIIMGFFTVLLLIACSTQELQKFTYNTGAAVACRHANDNLPNEKELDFECLNSQAADEMSYDAYIELKNELEKHTKHTGSRSIRGQVSHFPLELFRSGKMGNRRPDPGNA